MGRRNDFSGVIDQGSHHTQIDFLQCENFLCLIWTWLVRVSEIMDLPLHNSYKCTVIEIMQNEF
jgi:hypothetical protein